MAGKTKEQREAEKKIEDERIQTLMNANEEDLSPEELKERSELITKKMDDDKEAKRLQREQIQREQNAGAPGGEKMYSESQMRAIVKEMLKEMNIKGGSPDVDDDEEAFAKKKIRLPRFQNKFIVGFKNTNTDPYFPELVIQAFDVWNEQTKKMDAWVDVIFLDGSDLKMPLYSIITRSTKVECDLIEVVPTPKNYDNGKVEIMGEVKEYSRVGTGATTKLKVMVNEYKFKIKIPGTNEIVEVGPEVVNW